MSKSIPSEKIVNGMILSVDQINRYGQVLIKKGTELKTDHIKLLQTWGIDRVSVMDDNISEEDSPHYKKKVEELEKKLAVRMLWEPSNIYEMDMYRAVINIKIDE